MDVDGFLKVSYKSRTSKNRTGRITQTNTSLSLSLDKEYFLKKICEAKSEVLSSDLFKSVCTSLKEGLFILNDSAIAEIVCLGLGRIGECVTSRYQFAFILCLKTLFDVTISAYDPIFTKNDIELLGYFNVTVLKENLEGKHKTLGENKVLFFLPHCPKQLTNNLLWVNWSHNLSSCIIIANSFNKIVGNCSRRTLEQSAGYISKILPYVLEYPIINNFKYHDIFNDLAIHVFPKLNVVSQDLWKINSEPKYIEDIEFITKNDSKSPV